MPNTEANDWKTLTDKQVYDNPWITVHHREVINPSGGNGIYGLVKFKNKAVGILPIDEHGMTYLVGQYRYPTQSYSWEIPEGGCPQGEDPLGAAQRELLEETGLIADDWSVLSETLHTSNSVTDEVATLYLAKGLTQGKCDPEETENLQVKKVKIEEAIAMASDGRITDLMSVTALLMYALHHSGN